MFTPVDAIKGPLHQSSTRSSLVDVACFLGPALFYRFTNILPIYATAILRVASTHAFLAFHYVAYDKENYETKLQQAQLNRERKEYLTGATSSWLALVRGWAMRVA